MTIPDRGAHVVRPAYAKVNLCLHVTGQRDDGYHLLDSLVVRVGVGDTLTAVLDDRLSLSVDGPRAGGVPTGAQNLVMRAAYLVDAGAGRGAALHLIKELPNAAGIGGGSADAAATLLALSALWGVPLPEDVARLGADVPVCLSDAPQRMRGVGEVLTPVDGVPPMWVVLVNPGVPVPTPQVFAALASKSNPPMPDRLPDWPDAAAFAAWLAEHRNDLEPPARALLPQIDRALAALDGAMLARMSGSGATCFGLHASARDARDAAARIASDHPDWWVADAPVLRG